MSLEEIFRMISAKNESKKPEPPTWIVVGLGNPGRKYETSRHNVGFETLKFFEEKYAFQITRLEFKALTARATLPLPNGEKASVLFMRPQTFMNSSGEAVAAAADFYKIPADHVVVIYDDVSMPEGQIRIRPKGSDGGHNGIKSIIYMLNSDQFPRMKIGVGAPPFKEYDMADWVLGTPDEPARKAIAKAAASAPEAVTEIMAYGWQKAANDFNGDPDKKKPLPRKKDE